MLSGSLFPDHYYRELMSVREKLLPLRSELVAFMPSVNFPKESHCSYRLQWIRYFLLTPKGMSRWSHILIHRSAPYILFKWSQWSSMRCLRWNLPKMGYTASQLWMRPWGWIYVFSNLDGNSQVYRVSDDALNSIDLRWNDVQIGESGWFTLTIG